MLSIYQPLIHTELMYKNSNSLALPTRKLMLRALTGALHVTMCDAASLMHHWCRPSAVHKLSFTPTPECQSLWIRTVSKRNWKQKHKSDKRANKHNSYNLIRNHYPIHSRQSFLAIFCSISDRVLLFGREVYFVWQSFITLLVSVELAGTLHSTMYNVATNDIASLPFEASPGLRPRPWTWGCTASNMTHLC